MQHRTPMRRRVGTVLGLALTAVLAIAACTPGGGGATANPGGTSAPIGTDAMSTDLLSTDGITSTPEATE